MAITTARSFPVLLDITRLTSRVGRGPHTGIDRVELAYLNWCLSTEPDLWALAKVAGGYALLDHAGAQAFHDRLTGTTPWGGRDLRAVIGIKTPAPRGAAESDLRRLAKFHGTVTELVPQFEAIAKAGTVYLNTGHSNISAPLIHALKGAGLKVVTFLHDLIPLEFPDLQRAGTVPKFDLKVDTIARDSHLVITNSKTSESAIMAETNRRGSNVPVVHAHLGIDVPSTRIPNNARDRSYFLTIGTIEPRKNHALLLDIWQEFEQELPDDQMPNLHIIGQRGWVSENVIARLDALKPNAWVHEYSSLTDAELWPLLTNAQALLFPSLAEGFGLPTLEAAALGTPVICGDLAIHHELLGDYPVYVDMQDRYLWKKTIIEHAGIELSSLRNACAELKPQIPSWDAHFARVNHAVTGLA